MLFRNKIATVSGWSDRPISNLINVILIELIMSHKIWKFSPKTRITFIYLFLKCEAAPNEAAYLKHQIY